MMVLNIPKQILERLTWQEKTKLVQKDPVTCSRYFDHRVQEFLNTILKEGTSRQRSGKGAIRKRFPLQKPRWEKTKLTIRYLYHETYRKPYEKVQEGKDQEKAQSEKDSHFKNRGEKKNN